MANNPLIDILRKLSRMGDDFDKAADALVMAASLEQAQGERMAHLNVLDGEIAVRAETLTALTAKAEELSASVRDTETSLYNTRSQRLGEIEVEVANRRAELMSAALSDRAALVAAVEDLTSQRAALLAEVADLTSTRDYLRAEVDAAKQRIAAL